jgi:hypothetical protein
MTCTLQLVEEPSSRYGGHGQREAGRVCPTGKTTTGRTAHAGQEPGMGSTVVEPPNLALLWPR